MPWKTYDPNNIPKPKAKAMPRVKKPKPKTTPKAIKVLSKGLFVPEVPEKPIYAHQTVSAKFSLENDRILDFSDAGTGKSRSHLTAWATRRQHGGGRLLILAPKSVMHPAWVGDLMEFYRGKYTASVAEAHNRLESFQRPADVLITNLDAVKWLAKQPDGWVQSLGCDTLVVDESEAFKHRTSQRSKAASYVAGLFPRFAGLSGTPQNKSVTEIWHQAYLADFGQRLGNNFYQFRSVCCEPTQIGPDRNHVRWDDKEGIDEIVASMISDMTVRHKFDECLDIPANTRRIIEIDLSTQHMARYQKLKDTSRLELMQGEVNAVNAAVLASKLLQLTSGAVYDSEGGYLLIDPTRYELIVELVSQRSWPCVVFFHWRHQRDEIIKHAEKKGITYEYIDGTVPVRKRKEIVAKYQAGNLQMALIQPKSAGHGITLTRGRTTIWASPTREPNIFKQGSHRIYRAGQKHKTETLLITARNTLEIGVFHDLTLRGGKMTKLLDMVS